MAERQLFDNLESEGEKIINIEEIAFKAFQMKFLTLHITSHKSSFDIFTVGHLQNVFMEHDLDLIYYDFWHKSQINNFDPYNVLLAIAAKIPMLLMTSFVVQGHISAFRSRKKMAYGPLTLCNAGARTGTRKPL